MNVVLQMLIVVLVVVVPAVAILWIRDRVVEWRWRRRNPPEKVAAERKRRMLNPDWAFCERHLQRPVPQALRVLYSDQSLVSAQRLLFEDLVLWLEPLDAQSSHEFERAFTFEGLPIATTTFGDSVYLRPGGSEADTVYMSYPDGGDMKVLAVSVSSMLEKLRPQPNGRAIR